MRLTATLVDEIGGEIEAAAVAGQPIELDERQLDFLVAVIAALLAGAPPEGRGDVVEVAPPYDQTGNTALVGASLMFEILCLVADSNFGSGKRATATLR